jgi:hypothetical protein
VLWKLADLAKLALRARDGVLGRIDELYLSDEDFTVRYLVAALEDEAGSRVLVSPLALLIPNGPARVLPVDLSRGQIEGAPRADTELPVSRRYETRYFDYYRWPYYWVGGSTWGPFLTPGQLSRVALHRAPSDSDEESEADGDPHLRSTKELVGYRFEGQDGELGRIRDSIVDVENWTVKFLEIDTRSWWPGGSSVLLPRDHVRDVNFGDRRIRSELSRRLVREAPTFDGPSPISPDYERKLVQHYALGLTAVGFR